MPLARATNVDELAESFRQPNDFDGTILEVIAAPHDSGRMWQGKWNFDWSPVNLAFHIHMRPDDESEDPFWAIVSATNFGGLQWYIAATDNVEPDAELSDIDYPGSPVAPDGLDMDAMHDELESLWNSDAVGGDVGLYQQAMRDRWGGHVPWAIGREVGLPTRTNWSFYLEQLDKLANFRDAVKQLHGDNAENLTPHTLLAGFHGHFERVEVPSQSSKSAMKGDPKKKPFELLVPTRFDEFVDASKVGASGSGKAGASASSKSTGASKATTTAAKAAATTTAATTTDDDVAADFTVALIEALEANDGELDKAGIRAVAMDAAKWSKEQRRITVRLKADDDFLSSVGTWDGETLTL